MPESRRRGLELDANIPVTGFPHLPAHHHAADHFLAGQFMNQNDGLTGQHTFFQGQPAAVGTHGERPGVFHADGILWTLADYLDGNINAEPRASALRLGVGAGCRS